MTCAYAQIRWANASIADEFQTCYGIARRIKTLFKLVIREYIVDTTLILVNDYGVRTAAFPISSAKPVIHHTQIIAIASR